MSLAWSDRAWKHSRAKGSGLLVLLAIADNADEATGLAWPSVAYLCRKTRLSERPVQRCIQALAELGELAIEAKPGSANRYRLTIPAALIPDEKIPAEGGGAGAGGVESTGVASPPPGGGVSAGGGGGAGAGGGVALAPPRTVSEPSEKLTVRNRQGRGARLPDPWPLTLELRTYATGKGCRNPERLHESFTNHYRGNGKTQLDWAATWRQWVLGAHGGPAWKACGCAPPLRAVGKPTTMDAVQSLAAKIAAREGLGA